MKRLLIDVETTGFDEEKDQITEIAAIVEDENCNVVDRLEMKLKLMENTVPNLPALLITKINPFTKEWNDEAITPYEAVQKLKEFCLKHGEMTFTAYNAPFDEARIRRLMKVCLEDFDDYFNESIFDPLITAKRLVDSGKIKTKMIQGKKGLYPSARLGDVAIALGVITEEKLEGLHRAMEDTELMSATIKELFLLETGQKMESLKSNPQDFEKGDIVNAITNTKDYGLKKHKLYVLSNEDNEILAIDLTTWEKTGLRMNVMQRLSYGDFLVGEKEEKTPFSEKFYIRNLSQIRMLKNLISREEKEVVIKEENNFDIIKEVESSEPPYHKDENIVSLAEQLRLSKGEKGWSGILPHMESEEVDFAEGEVKKENVKVYMNPAGFYQIQAVGKVRRAYTKGDIGPTIASMIEGAPKGGKTIKAIEKQLKLVKDFTNPKHPVSMMLEVRDIIKKSKDFSSLEKKIVNDAVVYYKKKYPKTFKIFKTPVLP